MKPIWEAFGWHVEVCDGHSIPLLAEKLNCGHEAKPLVILAQTVKGKGVSFMENNNAWHHAALKEEDYMNAMREIEIAYGL